jgi:predicted RNA binding protein YcfA (HicA-like mRNA interferase family)
MKPKKLLARLARGTVTNVAFADLQRLVESMGFELQRINGSHHIFVHPDVPSPINLQSVNGQAKPYQVRQVLRVVERYALILESEP